MLRLNDAESRRNDEATNSSDYNHRAAQLRQELLSGEYSGLTPISYDSFAAEHLQQLGSTLSEGSYVEHQRALRQFQTACQPKDLTVIDFQMLEKFRSARIEDKTSPATVNKALRNLQAALERGVKRGYIKTNPCKGNRKALFVPEPEPARSASTERTRVTRSMTPSS